MKRVSSPHPFFTEEVARRFFGAVTVGASAGESISPDL
jgi:hypothetical protein